MDVALFKAVTCALDSEGEAWCWGKNSYLYDNSIDSNGERTTPFHLSIVPNSRSLHAFAGGLCGVASTNATRWCFGDNGLSTIGDGGAAASYTASDPYVVSFSSQFNDTPVTIGSSGGYNFCGIQSNGRAMCWGRNTVGEIGNGTMGTQSTPISSLNGLEYTHIAQGETHACGVPVSGGVRCWGAGSEGQLGNSASSDSASNVAVSNISGTVSQVAVGSQGSCALLASGAIQCWGSNNKGTIGDNQVCDPIRCNSAQDVAGISGATAIAMAGKTAYAVLSDGTLRCWGENAGGAFGDGGGTQSNIPKACADGVTGIERVFAFNGSGGVTACALTNAGAIYCWGSNSSSQTGVSSAVSAQTETPHGPIVVP